MRITNCTQDDEDAWAGLRHALWPDAAPGVLRKEVRGLRLRADAVCLVACDGAAIIGFAEAVIRHDYVNGCETSPVAFLEGLYVVEAWRRRGVARALVQRVADWARTQGLSELASDALLDNVRSHAMHRALGFAETERVVCFRRGL